MEKKYRYDIYFYTLIDSKGKFETIEGKDVVCVGISTKPDKSLKFAQSKTSKTVFVMLVKNISDKDKTNLLESIEELRMHKQWYQLEPIAGLIKKKCMEIEFMPYKLENANKKEVDNESRGVLKF